MRAFVTRALQEQSHLEVAEAPDGEQAKKLLQSDSFDVVVTDLNMPEMDGATLLKKVKASPRFHDIPVIVITSGYNPAKSEELQKMGAMAVMEKPVSPPALMAVLTTFIQPEEKSNDGAAW